MIIALVYLVSHADPYIKRDQDLVIRVFEAVEANNVQSLKCYRNVKGKQEIRGIRPCFQSPRYGPLGGNPSKQCDILSFCQKRVCR